MQIPFSTVPGYPPYARLLDGQLKVWHGLLLALIASRQQFHAPMVGRAGFEPATRGLRVRCSTN